MRILVTGGSGFIGTNLVAFLTSRGCDVLNLDIAPPRIELLAAWERVDVADYHKVEQAARAFSPTHLVHLAALATFDASMTELTQRNVDVTANILNLALKRGTVERLILTSTQYVNGPGSPFDEDRSFHPVNDYGRSKMAMELLAREPRFAQLPWIIVRPTNIWGPHHVHFATEMWRFIKHGLYLHPAGDPVLRAYGYVENVARQAHILLTAPTPMVLHKVFYLTDPVIDSYELLNAFSLALAGRKLHRVPRRLMQGLARAGDALKRIRIAAPFHSERYHRMTANHAARFEPLWGQFDYQAIAMEEGVARTVSWLTDAYPRLYA